jgi:hypothetical protein
MLQTIINLTDVENTEHSIEESSLSGVHQYRIMTA